MQPPAAAKTGTMRAVRANKNSVIVGETHYKALCHGGLQIHVITVCRFISTRSPSHIVTLFYHCHLIQYIFIMKLLIIAAFNFVI